MYKAVALAGGIREPLLTCSSSYSEHTIKYAYNFFFFVEEPLLVPHLFYPSIGMQWVGEDHSTIIPFNLCHAHAIS